MNLLFLIAALQRDIENRLLEDEKDNPSGGSKKTKTRRQRNQRRTSASDGSNFNLAGNTGGGVGKGVVTSHFTGPSYINPQSLHHQLQPQRFNRSDHSLIKILLLLLGFLCILNIFLVYKMWSLESKISLKSESLSSYQLFSVEPPQRTSDWLEILQKQELLHNQELTNWKTAVEAATDLLHQTEKSMLGVAKSFTSNSHNQIIRDLLNIEADTYKKAVLKHVIDTEL